MRSDLLLAERLTERCRTTLRSWNAPSEDQERLRQSYLHHLDTNRHGWARSCAGAHLTASSLICAVEGAQVLLTLHGRLGRWLQTGGHVEPSDASLEDAAQREAVEESGLIRLGLDREPLLLSRHAVPCGPVRPTFHLDVQYLASVPRAGEPTRSEESTDLRWFHVDRLPEVDHSVRALVDAASNRLGW